MNMISNIAAPAAFIDRITSELEAITTSWNRIAEALSEADEMFGCDSQAFKDILKATKFSRATATKLVKIARSERLRDNAAAFARCQAWTTLYEITTLTDEQFDELLDNLVDGEVVTFGMIRKIKAAPKQVDPYKVAFTVRVDENALRGGLVDTAELERLLNLVAQIQDTVPYVRVDNADRFDEQNSRYMSDLMLEYDRLMRAHLSAAIEECKRNSSAWKSYKRKKGINPPLLGPYCNIDEVRSSFKENPIEVLQSLEYSGYSQHKTWAEAEQALSRKYKRFTDKASQPFQYANSVIRDCVGFDDGCAVIAA